MLVGINGQLGAGKDAFYERARHMVERGYADAPATPTRRAFADKLKQSVAALFGITLEFMEEAKRDETTLVQIRTLRFGVSRLRGLRWTRHIPGFERIVVSQTMRVTLQRKGTEAGREVFGDSFWVDQCVPADLDHEGEAIFVTDVRFPNEAQRIKDAGGFVVRVSAGALNGDAHPSEQVLDSQLISLEVDNSVRDDGFANLDRQVAFLLKSTADADRGRAAHAERKVEQEERRIIRRGTRDVGAVVRMEDKTRDE